MASDADAEARVRVMFVCKGNICRSPTAEAIFRHHVKAAGLDHTIHIDSAGTDADVGWAPDDRSESAAAGRGYSLRGIVAKQLTSKHCTEFDYLVTLDDQNTRRAKRIAPSDATHKVQRLMAFVPDRVSHELDVPDPYYDGEEAFELVVDLVEEGTAALLQHIVRTHKLCT